jgi:hypothetical protein
MTCDVANGWLSTSHCADLMGVSTGFVRGEIRDGRLRASKLLRSGKRPIYRVAPADFATYLAKHWDRTGASPYSARSA